MEIRDHLTTDKSFLISCEHDFKTHFSSQSDNKLVPSDISQ